MTNKEKMEKVERIQFVLDIDSDEIEKIFRRNQELRLEATKLLLEMEFPEIETN